ncbi:MAG: hypothetical protein AABO58_00100 [Acidobacteriota bacterium]
MKNPFAVDRWPLAEKGGSANGQRPTANEPNWRLLYSLVIGELILTIALFYAFTKVFA